METINGVLKVIGFDPGGALNTILNQELLGILLMIHDEGGVPVLYTTIVLCRKKTLDRVKDGTKSELVPLAGILFRVGDSYENRAEILECSKMRYPFYVKNGIPMLWDLNNSQLEAFRSNDHCKGNILSAVTK